MPISKFSPLNSLVDTTANKLCYIACYEDDDISRTSAAACNVFLSKGDYTSGCSFKAAAKAAVSLPAGNQADLKEGDENFISSLEPSFEVTPTIVTTAVNGVRALAIESSNEKEQAEASGASNFLSRLKERVYRKATAQPASVTTANIKQRIAKLFVEQSTANAVKATDIHWCFLTEGRRRNWIDLPLGLGCKPADNHFKFHPKLFASVKRMQSQLNDRVQKIVSKRVTVALNQDFLGLPHVEAISLEKFWKLAEEQTTQQKDLMALKERFETFQKGINDRLIVKNKKFRDLYNPKTARELYNGTANDPTDEGFKKFLSGHRTQIANYVKTEMAKFWELKENKPLHAEFKKLKIDFEKYLSVKVIELFDNLVDEYAKHSYERFHRLFVVHTDFVNRIGMLQDSLYQKYKYPWKKIYTLMQDRTANTDQNYRKTQGKHLKDKELNKVAIKEGNQSIPGCLVRSGYINTMSIIFPKSKAKNSENFMFWQDAHTIPFPGIFSWKYSNGLSKTDFGVLKERFKSKNPLEVNEDFRKLFIDTCQDSKPNDVINTCIPLVVNWALMYSSETSHGPKICNDLDHFTEVRILDKTKTYKELLRYGLLRMLKKALKQQHSNKNAKKESVKDLTIGNCAGNHSKYLSISRDTLKSEIRAMAKRVTIVGMLKMQMLSHAFLAIQAAEASVPDVQHNTHQDFNAFE